MDFSKFSDDDLKAIAAGDMSKVSDGALRLIAGQPETKIPAEKQKDPGFLGGIGKGFERTANRLADGILQTYYSMKGGEGADAVLRGLKPLADKDTAEFAQIAKMRPFAAGIGETLPYLAVPGGQATALGRIAAPTAAMVAGEGLSYGTAKERATNAAKGGLMAAAGGVVGEGLGRIIKPVRGGLTPEKEVLDAAERIGAPLTAGQRSGSKGLQKIEDMIAEAPGGYGIMAKNAQLRTDAVNRAAASAIGQTDDKITQDVLANAKSGLGAVRDQLRSNVNVSPVDPNVMGAVRRAEQFAQQGLPSMAPETKKAVSGAIDDFKSFVQNPQNMDGAAYQLWRTDLNNAADRAFKEGNKKVGKVYEELLGGLDNAARGNNAPAWKANDKAFSTLDLLQQPNVLNEATGNVNPKSLSAAFYREFGDSAKQGKLPGNIQDIALLAKGIPERTTGSATAPRQLLSGMIGAAGGLAATGNVLPAAAVMTVPALTAILAKSLTSPAAAKYVAEGILSKDPARQQAAILLMNTLGRQSTMGSLEGAGNLRQPARQP